MALKGSILKGKTIEGVVDIKYINTTCDDLQNSIATLSIAMGHLGHTGFT